MSDIPHSLNTLMDAMKLSPDEKERVMTAETREPQPRVPCDGWTEEKDGEGCSILRGGDAFSAHAYHDGIYLVYIGMHCLASGSRKNLDDAKLAAEDALEQLARDILAGIGRG
jgi:hypothetical protein